MSLKVTSEAIQALKTLKSRAEELHQDLLTGTSTLKTAFDENKNGLGAHSNSISKLLEDLGAEGTSAGTPVKKLTRRLDTSIVIRQKVIDDDPYSAGGRSR